MFNSIFHWHNVSYSLNVKRILIEPSMFVPNARFAHFPISLHRSLVLALTSDESIPKIRKKKLLYLRLVHENASRIAYVTWFAFRYVATVIRLRIETCARFYSLQCDSILKRQGKSDDEREYSLCCCFTFEIKSVRANTLKNITDYFNAEFSSIGNWRIESRRLSYTLTIRISVWHLQNSWLD